MFSIHLKNSKQNSDRLDIVELLIKHGANVNAKTNVKMKTPLHTAAENGKNKSFYHTNFNFEYSISYE